MSKAKTAIKINGVEYPSQRKACEELGLARRTIQRRVEKLGKTFEEVAEMMLLEKKDMKKASKEISSNTDVKEKVMEKKEQPAKKKSKPSTSTSKSEPVFVLGVEFTSQNHASRVIGVTRSTMQRRAVRNDTSFGIEIEKHCKENNITKEYLLEALGVVEDTSVAKADKPVEVLEAIPVKSEPKVDVDIFKDKHFMMKTNFISNNPEIVKEFFMQLSNDKGGTDFTKHSQLIFNYYEKLNEESENLSKDDFAKIFEVIPFKMTDGKVLTYGTISKLLPRMNEDIFFKMFENTIANCELLFPEYLDYLNYKYENMMNYVANVIYQLSKNNSVSGNGYFTCKSFTTLKTKSEEELLPFIEIYTNKEMVKFKHIQYSRLMGLEITSFEALVALYASIDHNNEFGTFLTFNSSGDVNVEENLVIGLNMLSQIKKDVSFIDTLEVFVDGLDVFHSLIRNPKDKQNMLFYILVDELFLPVQDLNKIERIMQDKDNVAQVKYTEIPAYLVNAISALDNDCEWLKKDYMKYVEVYEKDLNEEEIVLSDTVKFKNLSVACNKANIDKKIVLNYKHVSGKPEMSDTEAFKDVLSIINDKKTYKNVFNTFQELTPHQKKILAIMSKGYYITKKENSFKFITHDFKEAPELDSQFSGNNAIKSTTIVAILSSNLSEAKELNLNSRNKIKVIRVTERMKCLKKYAVALSMYKRCVNYTHE